METSNGELTQLNFRNDDWFDIVIDEFLRYHSIPFETFNIKYIYSRFDFSFYIVIILKTLSSQLPTLRDGESRGQYRCIDTGGV